MRAAIKKGDVKMRVGVIGTGKMGKNHVRVYSELRGVDEIYVYDVNKANAERMKEYGAVVVTDLNELLNKVEIASICASTQYHFELARKAIEKDVNILIEKPITVNAKEGRELINLLKGKDLVVGVGHIERFNPIVGEIKKIVSKPTYIEIKRHNPASKRITDTTVVEDLMIHDIDILFNVLMKNEKDFDIYSAGNGDLYKTLVVFKNTVASLSASRMASKKIRTIYIETEDFTLEGDFMSQEIYVYKKPEKYHIEDEKYMQENIIEKVLINKIEPLKVELKMFVDAVEKHKEFPVTPEQAVRNIELADFIRNKGNKI